MLGGVRIVSKEVLKNAKQNEAKPASDDAVEKRKEAGLEWMTAAPSRPKVSEAPSIEPNRKDDEQPSSNPKELNPYLKDGGGGYPSDTEAAIPSTRMKSGIGDGGASWRLKALKRAQEQAAREGKGLEEVVNDRFGSLSYLTAGITGRRAAHANAHLHAIRDRKRKVESSAEGGIEQTEEGRKVENRREDERKDEGRSYRSRMKEPRADDSLKWSSRRSSDRKQQMRAEDAAVLKSAAVSYNKFANDGTFLKKFKEQQAKNKAVEVTSDEPRSSASDPQRSQEARLHDGIAEAPAKDPNQLAAKAMKLRLMGQVDKADELMKEVEELKSSTKFTPGNDTVLRKITAKQRHDEENREFDQVLASKISRDRDGLRPDDEYDDVGIASDRHRRKSASKNAQRSKNSTAIQFNKLRTQVERCQFCFENPSRPKHLTVAIANFTYLMLPPVAPLVPGHCYIVPMQHEGSTRNVDDDVWEELRNFKKCLIKMFKQEEQEAIFIETVMGLSQQRRHCLVECVPVPFDAVKQAPLYFKKGIDEAEDEWSQHNSKKLIDTSVKGLRSSIPKNFPYFHVEFGLQGGYCHVIDDESSFNPHFGRDVLIGLLKLPQELMHQKARRYESHEQQVKTVQEFTRLWKPHDWTKMLD